MKQKELIKTLVEEKPAPLQANLNAINLDVEQVQKKVLEIHQVFGKPYRSAIGAFADSLQVNADDLYPKWKLTYEKEKNAETSDEQVFKKFIGEYDDLKVDTAISAFKTNIEKRTVEDFSQENINQLIQVLMEGLGLPRTMSPEACKAYMSRMNIGLNNLLKSQDVGVGLPMIVPEKTEIFNVYGDRLPTPEHVGFILRHYNLIEDIAYRLKETGIKGISFLEKISLEGTEGEGYLTLSYKMEIVSPMASIRDLINSFQNAYKDNRIYIIRDITFLKKAVDEIPTLTITIPDPQAPQTVKSPESEKGKKKKKDDSYGVPVIGDSTDVRAEIKIDYVIYIKDEIRRK